MRKILSFGAVALVGFCLSGCVVAHVVKGMANVVTGTSDDDKKKSDDD